MGTHIAQCNKQMVVVGVGVVAVGWGQGGGEAKWSQEL